MSHTAYVGILIFIFICFTIAFVVEGIIFSEYCSAVATAEGRLQELLNHAIGADGWGEYHIQLFVRLYKIENCNSENISLLKRRAKWGFNTVLVLVFSSVLVIYLAGMMSM